ncbi:MAG: single-stranded DNA-binding protein [Planctomycetes bacterium]|nr:single-stranded DNA-binding protein [Planctomycetota bacterium]
MASFNKVILIGNLTRDPQLSFLPSQTPVVEFGLASSRKYKKQDGTLCEDTCFVECQMFGKRAEVINQYLKKGDPLFVEGRLKFDSWEKDGQKRSKLRVFVENFEFLGKGGGQGGGNQGGGYQQSAPAPASNSVPSAPEAPQGGGMDDDIPF